MQENEMSRGITENDVWIASDALLLEGARPIGARDDAYLPSNAEQAYPRR